MQTIFLDQMHMQKLFCMPEARDVTFSYELNDPL